MPDESKLPHRVEIQRIGGDIFINGAREIFAVDAGQTTNVTHDNVDWLIGWAKIGLMSKGHIVPYFPAGRKEDMNPKRDTSALPSSETAPK